MISAVIVYEDNKVSVHSASAKDVSNNFPSGFYQAMVTDQGIVITKEQLLEIHSPWKSKDTEFIINTVSSFFNKGVREKVESLGFIHKLGILLHGKQGCGKTSVINFIAKELQEKSNAIVFFCNNGSTLGGAISIAKSIREVQDNPIVFIADEFERYARDSESEMKNLLDGKDSISNSLFLAATNYIDKVPDTLKDRPSRFRVVTEIKGIKDKNTMEEILLSISNKISPNLFKIKEIKEITANLDYATIDELKHKCLDKVTSTFIKNEPKRKKIGFEVEKDNECEKQATTWFTIPMNKSSFKNAKADSNI